MKSHNRGITITSLTIYVIVMAITIGILATLTTYFYKNVNDTSIKSDPIIEYTNFNSFFSDEVNKPNIKVVKCDSYKDENGEIIQNYILFNNGIQYTYVPENKGIYNQKVKIAKNIDKCTFSENIEKGKTIIKVHFESGNYIKDVEYTLSN